jgi:hypothetical protein
MNRFQQLDSQRVVGPHVNQFMSFGSASAFEKYEWNRWQTVYTTGNRFA